jgi:hypothetical protein
VQEAAGEHLGVLRPGEQDQLRFWTAAAQGDLARRRISTAAVVLSVEHELSLKKGAIRTITLAAISTSGADPIQITRL